MAKTGKLSRKENRQGYLFIFPWIIGFLVFISGPLLFSLFASFTNYNITTTMDWVGFDNYKTLLGEDRLFRTELYNTIYYVAISVPLTTIASILVSILLNNNVPGIKMFRTLFYLPAVLSGVAVTMLWMQILNPTSGLLNTVLGWFGIQGPAWLFNAAWTKPALIIMSLWNVGGNMLIYLSALKGIPRTLYESAVIDGAGWLRRTFKITLPMITPVIFFNVITGFIGAFQIFQSAYIITQSSSSGTSGPMNSLLFYNLYLWNKAFRSYQMGYASAMAWILFLIILVLTVLNLIASRFWVFYGGDDERNV